MVGMTTLDEDDAAVAPLVILYDPRCSESAACADIPTIASTPPCKKSISVW